jgi:EAL domain-containing protein (putative c-di-GMP-specific phosphodiesterase class I)
MNMLDDEDDAVIVRSTIDLARNLGLDVVAEGVESAEVWAHLGTLGCNSAQGFFLSRPVPAEELGAWLFARAGLAERSAA